MNDKSSSSYFLLLNKQSNTFFSYMSYYSYIDETRMTTSMSSDALLDHKKDTQKIKVEKKEEPKENKNSRKITKPLKYFYIYVFLQPNRQTDSQNMYRVDAQ